MLAGEREACCRGMGRVVTEGHAAVVGMWPEEGGRGGEGEGEGGRVVRRGGRADTLGTSRPRGPGKRLQSGAARLTDGRWR